MRMTWPDDEVRLEAVKHAVTYVMVVGLNLQQQEVARLLGRHHSTIAHSCKLIEDIRDDDEELDRRLEVLESILYETLPARILPVV
jgi:hypothetical protein